jgi:hypothetical protein
LLFDALTTIAPVTQRIAINMPMVMTLLDVTSFARGAGLFGIAAGVTATAAASRTPWSGAALALLCVPAVLFWDKAAGEPAGSAAWANEPRLKPIINIKTNLFMH